MLRITHLEIMSRLWVEVRVPEVLKLCMKYCLVKPHTLTVPPVARTVPL